MKQHKTNSQQDEIQPSNPFGPALSVSIADAVGKGASIFGRGFASMQQESLRFMNQRFEDNIKTAGEVGNCKTLPDLLALQQKWLAGMSRAYTDEWHRYNALMADLVRGDNHVATGAHATRGERAGGAT
jgi:hypothetical protein